MWYHSKFQHQGLGCTCLFRETSCWECFWWRNYYTLCLLIETWWWRLGGMEILCLLHHHLLLKVAIKNMYLLKMWEIWCSQFKKWLRPLPVNVVEPLGKLSLLLKRLVVIILCLIHHHLLLRVDQEHVFIKHVRAMMQSFQIMTKTLTNKFGGTTSKLNSST